MALISQHCILEIAQAGGGQRFAAQQGSSTININRVLAGMKQQVAAGASIDPALINFDFDGDHLIPIFLPRPLDVPLEADISSEKLYEPQWGNYRAILPDSVGVAADAAIPTEHQGKHYIRIGDYIYQVRFDDQRAAWCVHAEDATRMPFAVHYQEGGWKLRDIGALAPPATGTPHYDLLSMYTLDQLNDRARAFDNRRLGISLNAFDPFIENRLRPAFTAQGKILAPFIDRNFNNQLAAVGQALAQERGEAERVGNPAWNNELQALSKEYTRIRTRYNVLVQQYQPDALIEWRNYRAEEARVIRQMRVDDGNNHVAGDTVRNRVRTRVENHLNYNMGVNDQFVPQAGEHTRVNRARDITGAHMKGSFLNAIRHIQHEGKTVPAKILGYRTYAHAPGVIQVSYLMPWDDGYNLTDSPAHNGLSAPPVTTGTAPRGVPAALNPLQQVGPQHADSWHLYDEHSAWAPSPSPTTSSRSSPRLKTIFDPQMDNSIVRNIAQYMGYVDEVMDILKNGDFLRTEHMRYNVPVPSLSNNNIANPSGADIRMVMYFGSAVLNAANANDATTRLNSAYINTNSPALTAAYIDVVSNGLPQGASPGDLGNNLLRNAVHLHDFITAARGKAVTPAAGERTSRWIFQLNASAEQSTRELFLQDVHNNELILWNTDGSTDNMKSRLRWDSLNQSLRVDAIPSPTSSLKLMLVVNDTGAGTFDGRSIAQLTDDFRMLLRNINRESVASTAHIDVELIGCRIENMDSTAAHLASLLADGLRLRASSLNIDCKNLTFRAHQYARRTGAGGIQEVYVPGPGPGTGWVCNADIVDSNERDGALWRYDSKKQQMVAAVKPHRLVTLRNVVDRLYAGQATLATLMAGERKLVLRFMNESKIRQLLNRKYRKN